MRGKRLFGVDALVYWFHRDEVIDFDNIMSSDKTIISKLIKEAIKKAAETRP